MIVSMVILVKDLLCWFGVGGNVLCVGKLVRRVSECLGSGWWDAGMWIYGTKLNKTYFLSVAAIGVFSSMCRSIAGER